MKYDLILVRYGEIALKGKATRKHFENFLITNIKKALEKNNISFELEREWGRIYINTNNIELSIKILQKIFGITSISPAIKTRDKIDLISNIALNVSNEKLRKNKTFAVRVTRTGNHSFTSQDVAIKIGENIVNKIKAKVNLTNPDFELFIEIRDRFTYIFTNKIQGPGGMPLGTQGKLIALINSPESILATWYLMRRGCNIISIKNIDFDIELLKSFLSKWHADSEIIEIDSNDKNCYEFIKKISVIKKCNALVTAYSLYNDSQNVLSEIKLIKFILKIPIFHPLISMDKKDIQIKSKEIGIQI